MASFRSVVTDGWGVFWRRRIRVFVDSGSHVDWIRFRGVKGTSFVGKNCMISCRIDFDHPNGVVRIGDRCFIGASHIVCHSSVSIGDDVIISWGATIVDHNSHSLDWEGRKNDVRDWMQGKKDWSCVKVAPITIKDKVWIGFGSSILKGVTIGEGAVVGANAVVTRDVPPNTVVAGNPAQIVKQLEQDKRENADIGLAQARDVVEG